MTDLHSTDRSLERIVDESGIAIRKEKDTVSSCEMLDADLPLVWIPKWKSTKKRRQY